MLMSLPHTNGPGFPAPAASAATAKSTPAPFAAVDAPPIAPSAAIAPAAAGAPRAVAARPKPRGGPHQRLELRQPRREVVGADEAHYLRALLLGQRGARRQRTAPGEARHTVAIPLRCKDLSQVLQPGRHV